jgi:hypothetical protein
LKPQIAHQRSTTVHNVASGKMNLGNAWHSSPAKTASAQEMIQAAVGSLAAQAGRRRR